MAEEAEAEGLEIRAQTLPDELLLLGLRPLDPGLPADPPLLPLWLVLSPADPAGSPQ